MPDAPTAGRIDCLIVGGGPAGMVLGLLLARRGVPVTVLEKHGDFLRDVAGWVREGKIKYREDIAEGIENAAQERALRELGCPAGQGFLFAPALSAEQVGEFLRVRPAAAALH